MKDGYIRVAAASLNVAVADVEHNKSEILSCIRQAHEMQVNLLVLPELCLTGSSCQDLFASDMLLSAARRAAEDIVHETITRTPVVVFGMPLRHHGKLYNCAVVVAGGEILGVVPRSGQLACDAALGSHLFVGFDAAEESASMELAGKSAPFGAQLLFCHRTLENYVFGVEVGEDAWAMNAPAEAMCASGASIIACPSASAEIVGRAARRRAHVSDTSERLGCAYVCANASEGESTQDAVCSAHHIIAESGRIVGESAPFAFREMLVREIDTAHICCDRNTSRLESTSRLRRVIFDQDVVPLTFTTRPSKSPFLAYSNLRPADSAAAALDIQAHALAKRLAHTGARRAVIGVSGGLDSTLALLVALRAMKLLERPATDILAVTMPCFGTTERTRANAVKLCELLGVPLREIDITASVRQHFADIGQNEQNLDAAYENAQARERMQVLMDLANQENGLVIGTGDLSELALGFTTYNGDHMSMYGVNAGVPKTMVRLLVAYEAKRLGGELLPLMSDIVSTPVSPELLPPDQDGVTKQRTEDVVGPYELHDFLLYYTLRYGDAPAKLYRTACAAFEGVYDGVTVLHWMRVFYQRFFANQFKRSCLPDGPAVFAVSLSPRGAWRMPSDACATLWLDQLDGIVTEIQK